jgi:hypothetical protein
MSTFMPSPLYPSTVAVTTTNVSFATKFRMHLTRLLSPALFASISNFNASEQASRKNKLNTVRSNDWEYAMSTSMVFFNGCSSLKGKLLDVALSWEG